MCKIQLIKLANITKYIKIMLTLLFIKNVVTMPIIHNALMKFYHNNFIIYIIIYNLYNTILYN